MLIASKTVSDAVSPNALAPIKARVADGCISWTGPLILVVTRPVLFLTIQALLALVLLAMHKPAPWRAAGAWWNVYGTLVDLGCLIGLRYFTRKEGIGLRDLIGPIRMRHWRDVFLGLGYFLLIFPLFIAGGYLMQVLLWGSAAKAPIAYLIQAHSLPLWATAYSLTIWWFISSPTEEATFQGYALPRLQALTGRTWIAATIVGVCWAAQHSVLPFMPDWRFVLYRFFAFLPGVVAMMVIYLRTRRLTPLIFAHWPMDILGAIMTGFTEEQGSGVSLAGCRFRAAPQGLRKRCILRQFRRPLYRLLRHNGAKYRSSAAESCIELHLAVGIRYHSIGPRRKRKESSQ